MDIRNKQSRISHKINSAIIGFENVQSISYEYYLWILEKSDNSGSKSRLKGSKRISNQNFRGQITKYYRNIEHSRHNTMIADKTHFQVLDDVEKPLIYQKPSKATDSLKIEIKMKRNLKLLSGRKSRYNTIKLPPEVTPRWTNSIDESKVAYVSLISDAINTLNEDFDQPM